MKREELEIFTSCELYNQKTQRFGVGEVYAKAEADSVMDAMEARIKELEKKLEDVQNTMATENVDLGMKNFKLKERIKELEAEVEMDAKKWRIMVNGYNKKCDRVKELEEQCTKYQAELMNNDPALNYMPPTTEEK